MLFQIACLQLHSKTELSNINLKVLATAIISQNLFVFLQMPCNHCNHSYSFAIFDKISILILQARQQMELKGSHYFAVLNWAPSPVSTPVDTDINIDESDTDIDVDIDVE